MIKKLIASLSNISGLSCRQATRLAAKAMDTPLDRGERMELYCHHMICSTCRNYARQLKLMRSWLREFGQKIESPTGLSSSRKEEIKTRLKSEPPSEL